MELSPLNQIAAVLLIGIVAQWLAWRLRLPGILLLLAAGLFAGPGIGLIHPDTMMGDLLFPFIKVAVAIILFEGGLTLRLSDLRGAGLAVRNLVTIGVLITWLLASAAAYWIIGLPLNISILFGAVLTVTGPTVIGPLLRHIRPIGGVGKALNWEGILIDPVGATLAVLVFEEVLHGQDGSFAMMLFGLGKTMLWGSVFGFAGAGVMWVLARFRQLPEFLLTPVTLTMVVAAATASNHLAEESGLIAATLMGVIGANQKRIRIQQMLEFKENLRLLLITVLFVLLAARVERSELLAITGMDLLFVAVLILVIRPLATFASTAGTSLKWRERLLVAWMAPRGIVAAAVASIFAFELIRAGVPGAERLMPLTFLVIVITVVVYGLTAGPLARLLGLAEGHPQGMVFIGAHSFARKLAMQAQELGVRVLLVDANTSNIAAARREGLEAEHGNVLSETFVEELDLNGIGRALALTANDEVNTLANVRFAERFDADSVYQLAPSINSSGSRQSDMTRPELRGRTLFHESCTFDELESAFNDGATPRLFVVGEQDEDRFEPVQEQTPPAHQDEVILFVRRAQGNVIPVAAGDPPTLREGARVISLKGKPVEELLAQVRS